MKLRKITRKNKKGEIFQVVFLIVILFIAAIIGLISLALSNKITHTYEDSGLLGDVNSTAYKANHTVMLNAPSATDELVFFLFLGGNVGIIIAATRTKFSPTIIFLFILLALMAIAIAAGLVNIYQGFSQSDVLAGEHAQLKLTNIIFSKYTPLFFCLISGIVLIIMYSKSGSDIQV